MSCQEGVDWIVGGGTKAGGEETLFTDGPTCGEMGDQATSIFMRMRRKRIIFR